ncbi:MAG TPA: hypothetical protein PK537_00250 [Candidatus Limiplasma sp.]|nr:hypothetical protein [Candidatus Limiplasma sp.]
MAHNDRKRNRIYVLLAVLGIVLLLIYFGANQDDYYNTAVFADAFTAAADDASAVQSDRLMLEKGSYTFTVSYTATGEATAEIINDLTADGQGNPSPVLASVALDPNQTEATLTLTLDQTTRGIRVVLRGQVTAGVTQVLSDQPVWSDTAFYLLCIVLAAGVFVWLARRDRNTKGFPEGLALAVCLIAGGVASLPVMRDFFVYGHDLAFHLTRIESIKDGLLSGRFPVRIDPTFLNGYGYASSVMYGDLLLYIPALFRLCGVSMMVSWQAFIVLLNVTTAYLTYRAVKAWTGKAEVGLIAGVTYTLGIYRLMTLFTRAAAGEALAMLFYPLVIAGIVQVVTQNKGTKWLVIGMTGMLQTHLISLQIAAIGCALYTLLCVVLRKTSWRAIGRLCAAAGITILINLWFLVPLLTFSGLDLDIFQQEKQIWLYAAYLPQLFASFVNPYAGMTTFPGTTVEMPLSVGLLLGLGLVMFLFVSYQKREKRLDDTALYAIGRGAAIFAGLALVMASVVFPWTYVRKIPVLSKVLFAVQFPWRYLGAASALLAIVFAVSAYLLIKKPEHRRLLVLGCLLLAILNAAPFIDTAIQSDEQQVIVADKYADFVAPVYLPGDYFFAGTDVDTYLDRAPVPAAVDGDVAFSDYDKQYTTVSFDYAAAADTLVELPLYGYPTYRATLDGETELTLAAGDNNILTVALPAGTGHVEVAYAQPWTFTAADILSLLFILALLAWTIMKKHSHQTMGP